MSRLKTACKLMETLRETPNGMHVHDLSKKLEISYSGTRKIMSALTEVGVEFYRVDIHGKPPELSLYSIAEYGPFRPPTN